MARDSEDVKRPRFIGRCVDWIDRHPRTGWYLVVVATLNLLLNFFDAVDFNPLKLLGL